MKYFRKIKSLINVSLFLNGKDGNNYTLIVRFLGLPIFRIAKVYLP